MILKKPRRNRRRNERKSGDSIGQYASDAWSLAKRTAVGLNEIRKLINIETKFMDFYASTTYGNTFSVVCVSEIAQGLTSTTRVGDSLKIQHIYFKFMCVANNASSGSSVRILVFRDLDNSGTYPTATQFLESGNVSLSQVCPAKFNTRERFSILFDETVNVLVSSQSSACGGFSCDHAGHILYLGATAAQASNGKGSVFVAIYGTDNTNQATVTWWSRILYTDD